MENIQKPKFSAEIMASIEKIISNIKPNEDAVKIPNSNGLVLLRLDSKAYIERKDDTSIMFYEIEDDNTFCVASK